MFFGIGRASAATNVYYSVGQNTSNHSSGGNVSITGGVATFTVTQTETNLGVGDRLTAGGNIYYLALKTDTTHWNVVTKLGVAPVDLSSTSVTSIAHEYSSLSSAISGAKDANHINNADLTAANVILNIPCYYDSGPDSAGSVALSAYTSGPSNYINIYTPTDTSTQANQSQRHQGKWDNNKYRIEVTDLNGIQGSANYIRIDGLQVKCTMTTSAYRYGINIESKATTDVTDIRVSDNIVQAVASGTSNNSWGIVDYNGTSANVVRVWNNIVYGWNNNSSGLGIYMRNATAYVYGNTVYNDYTGMQGNVNVIAKDNIAQNTHTGYSGTWSSSSSNNISDHADAPGSNPQNSVFVTFIDAANKDFHLAPKSVATDAGVSISGTDPSFNSDIDGETRPSGSDWDIGADEDTHVQTDFTAPTITSFTMPTTATSLAVNVSAFAATDNVGVTGYLITESSSIPSRGNPNWSSTVPVSFTFAGGGTRTAYAWTRDYEGNISASTSQAVTMIASNVYYSVGQNTNDHSSGGDVSITGGVAAFTVAQTATNLGVGDRLTAGGNIYYLASKTSTSQWNVVTKLGAAPSDLASTAVTSIAHEYASLQAAITGAKDSNHINNADFIAANVALNIPCYYDSGPDSVVSTISLSSYTTGSTTYIRIYTPTSTGSEANLSQRHQGKWDDSKYRLEATGGSGGIGGKTNYIRIDGLQIKVTTSVTGSSGIGLGGKLQADITDIRLSNNIIWGTLSGSATDECAIAASAYYGTASSNTYRIWGNIIYGYLNGSAAWVCGIRIPGTINYIYNNTIANVGSGIRSENGAVVIAKNNIVQNSAVLGYSTNFDGSSSNNISDHADAPGSNPQNSVFVTFIDAANKDFHLAPKSVATDAGVSISGTDPSFNSDIDGETRPSGSDWDIGADEDTHVQTDFTAPTITSFTMPTTATSLAVNVSAFAATDNVGVTGYLITESSSVPSLASSSWSATVPASYTFNKAGTRDVYAWTKDWEGNISSSIHRSLNITLTGVSYYVDATGGNDSNAGTSADQAWKTIAKVNSSTFQAADRILFKRGETWREQLIISSSGVEGAPIAFDAYGSGSKPIISGADAISNWTNSSGSIYVADASPSNVPNQLYVDGNFHDIARYPNSGWLTATADSTDTTSIIDTNLTLTANQIVGATVLVRAVDWNITTLTATAYNPATHKITLSGNVYNGSQVMKAGRGFYLQNMPGMLDASGEWYYDSAAHKVYLWMSDNSDPSGHFVQISNRSYGISDNGKNYVMVQNLTVKDSNQYDVYVSGANNVTTSGLDVSGGQKGIYLANSSNSSVANNSVQNTLSNGIEATGSGSDNFVSNNSINNAGNVGTSPKHSNGGLYASGTTITLSNNTVTNSGYNGIIFSGSQHVIENNYIDMSCLVLDDCAGIYTSSPYNTIRGNTVKNSIGNAGGTTHTSTFAGGIYLDDLSHDISVLNNTVYNSDAGIFIHTGHDNTITGNSVYRSRTYGMLINRNTAGSPSGSVHDNTVTGNTFEYLGTDGTASYYDAIGSDDPADFGTFDNNHYYHPNSSYAVRTRNVNRSLSDWQQLSGQDLHSIDSASYYAPTLTGLAPDNQTFSVTTTSTDLTLDTNEITTCRYSATQGTDYASMTPFDYTDSTAHSTFISSLNTGTTYNYYIKCQNNVAIESSEADLTFFVAPEEQKVSLNSVSIKIERTVNRFKDTLYIKKNKFKLKGRDSALVNGTIKIYKGNKLWKTVIANEVGAWSKTIKLADDVLKTIKLKFFDSWGTLLGTKKAKAKIDTEDPEFKVFPPEDKVVYTAYTREENRMLVYRAEDNQKIDKYKIEFNGKITDKKPTSKDRDKSQTFFVPKETPKGIYTFKVTAYDKAGNKGEKEVSMVVK